MISDVLTEATEKMAKAVDVAKDDFATVRTGRINPALFQKIPVDYYGTPTPLAQLASMQTPEARTLVVTRTTSRPSRRSSAPSRRSRTSARARPTTARSSA